MLEAGEKVVSISEATGGSTNDGFRAMRRVQSVHGRRSHRDAPACGVVLAHCLFHKILQQRHALHLVSAKKWASTAQRSLGAQTRAIAVYAAIRPGLVRSTGS